MTYLKYHIEQNRGIPAESGQVKMKLFLLSLAARVRREKGTIESLSSRRFCHHGRQIAEEVWIDNGVFGAKF